MAIHKFLEQLFGSSVQNIDQPLNKNQLNLATAALLIEVGISDQTLANEELDQIQASLKTHCQLEPDQITSLIEDAKSASKEAISLYEFTSQINSHADHTSKVQLVENLWKIAYADGVLDKHETHIIKRISDLLHLSQAEYIRAKQNAKPSS